MKKFKVGRQVGIAALFAASAALSACDQDREAEAETPVSEAEVGTDLPEAAVSDEQLQATADAAAEVASEPLPDVVAVPVPGETGAGATQTTGTQQGQTQPTQ